MQRMKRINIDNSTIEEIKQCIAKSVLPINYINFIENKLKIQKSELSIHQEDYTELLKL